MKNPGVRKENEQLKQNRLNREMLDESDIFQKYMDIAFADMTDYAEFGNETYQDPDTGKELKYSFVHLKDSGVVDGTLISEVSKGKDGAKIKLLDKMKAMQWLTDHMDLATEKQKAEIAVLKAKMQQDDEDVEDDGFLEALKGEVSEVWADE